MEIRLENNYFEDWCKAKKEAELLMQQNKIDKTDTLNINVILADEITNLIYFFPIEDVAREYGIAVELHIFIDTKTKNYKKILFSTYHLLYVQSKVGHSSKITINNRELNAVQTRFGNLQPLTMVTGETNAFNYKLLYSDKVDYSILSDLKEIVTSSIIFKTISKKNWTKLYKIINSDIGRNYITDNEIKEFNSQLEQTWTKNSNVTWGSLFHISSDFNLEQIYRNLCISNIIYTINSIIGNKEVKIEKETKKKLAEQLIDYFINNISNIPLFTQYLWTLFIRYSLDAKLSLNLSDSESICFLDIILVNSLVTASSYADGMYQIIENACIHSKSQCGYFYIRVYQTGKNTNHEVKIKNLEVLNRLEKKYKGMKLSETPYCHFEIVFVDNAMDRTGVVGMVDHYNNANSGIRKAKNLEELFTRVPLNNDDLLTHYGLKVFERTAVMNGGFFVYTPSSDPSEKGYSYTNYIFKKENKEESQEESEYYSGSIYHILFPIQDLQMPKENFKSCSKSECFFDTSGILNNYIPFRVDIKTDNEFSNMEEKKNVLDKMYEELLTQIKDIQDTDKRILCIRPASGKYYDIEILAKVIMRYSIENKEKYNKIALLLDSKYQINEFVRIYTAFFDKSGLNYEQFKIINTQIALCRIGHNQVPEVCFVLNGNNMNTVRKTARNHIYYNSRSGAEFIPLVMYLTKLHYCEQENKILKEDQEPAIFPFDLYLDMNFDEEEYDNQKVEATEDKIWFFRYIDKILNRNMQEEEYGCKLPNVHISMGSKIHIDTFYNAELLFHNYATVSRFSYIIAKDLLKEYTENINLEKKKKIELVAYGEYSILMIQLVKEIMQKVLNSLYADIVVNYIPFLPNSDEGNTKDGGLWPEFSRLIANNCGEQKGEKEPDVQDYKFHIILPIATTLTTIRKIQSIMKQLYPKNKESNNDLFFGKNISLIIVGGLEKGKEAIQGVEEKYWESVEKRAKLITIGQFDKTDVGNKLPRMTRYYFYAKCIWYKALEDRCELCNLIIKKKGKFRSLIGVDKTSTLPKAIFESVAIAKNNFDESPENDKRIEDLCGFVTFSHIKDEYNHFKFDIDYREFSHNEKVREKVQNWLIKDINPKVDVNAFNIIVSPLNVINSIFLSQVIDNVFEGNIRLFNIPINTALRDEIRTKFSYIADEYRQMKQIMGTTKIHVYFVDDCITQGTTLQRGAKFIRMFFAQNGVHDEDIKIYKGIIVLANRSSYETIQNLLPGHVQDGFFSYIRLNVPLYNTYNGVCPSCVMAEQYLLMHKRASTHMIANEYKRLYDKHIAKERTEYNKWLEKQIVSNYSYFRRFRQWIYYATCSEKHEYYYVDILGRKHDATNVCFNKREQLLFLNKHLEKLLNAKNTETFEVYYNDKDNIDTLSKIIKQHIIKDKDYMRMFCTHTIFEMLDKKVKVDKIDKLEEETRKEILDLLNEQLKKITKISANNKYPKKIEMWIKAEWIISYLKIASRKQPSQYYHVKNVLYNIMIEIADVLVGMDNTDPSNDIRFLTDICNVSPNNRSDNSIMPDMKYTIFLTIIRRLSVMHSLYVIEKTDAIIDFCNKCRLQYEAKDEYAQFYVTYEERSLYKRLVEFPSASAFDLTVAKLIKWSAMSGYDESKCFAIENRYTPFTNSESKEIYLRCKKIAFLENTQIIYSGIKRLTNGYHDKFDNMTAVREYVNNIYNNAYDQEKTLYEMNEHKLFFHFMEQCEYHKNGSNVLLVEIYTQMIILFHTLQTLEKRESLLDTPYPYETICNCMRDIAEYHQCRIVSRKEHRILTVASSDIDEKYIKRDLDDSIIDTILGEFENVRDKNQFDKIVQKFILGNQDEEKFKTKILVISLPIIDHDMPNTYVILYKDNIPQSTKTCKPTKENLSKEEMWNVRNILFLRDTFEAILARDIVSLRDMIHSYSYVKKISNGDMVKILHISDLHITEESADEIQNKIQQQKDLSMIKPDLLLITGDVITGKYSGRQITKAYEAAQSVIIELVKSIWKIETTIGPRKNIRSDWKKRILISIGNHDYASMNELAAQNKMRATTSGEPDAIGSVMVKHSYFVHFLHDLLGNDIDDLVRYDLNRIINYTELKITVANINTNSDVNPFRTDKVGINADAVKEMFTHSNISDTIVYMMHHTPMYHIDYVNDVYHLNNKETCNMIMKKAEKSEKFVVTDVFEANKLWIRLIKSLSENFKNEIDSLDTEEQKKLMGDILDEIYKNDKRQYERINLEDFQYYLDCSNPELDDRCRSIVFSIKNKTFASEEDMKQYARVVHEHLQDIQKYCGDKLGYYILGGHTHRAAKFTGIPVKIMKECRGIYEAGRFLTKDGKMNYSIFQIGQNSKYAFAGESPEEKGDETEMINQIINIEDKSEKNE